MVYPIGDSQCPTQGCSDFVNITLRDVRIVEPLMSPGAILGNSTNPMENIVFDGVVVEGGGGRWPWREDTFPHKGTYKSFHVEGVAIKCDPVPDSFVEEVK